MQGHNIVVIFIGVAAAAAALAYYIGWKRRQDLKDLASSMGLLLSADGPDSAVLAATGLELFRYGHSGKALNLMRFPCRGGEIQVFDYRYVSGRGRNRHAHSFTVALISCSCSVPSFDLKPEGLLYKLGELVGFKDIDLPAFPLFSDKYRLTGSDEEAVHMFFTPKRAAWFEHNLGLSVQGAPGYLLLARGAGCLPARAWQGFIEEAKAFAAEILE